MSLGIRDIDIDSGEKLRELYINKKMSQSKCANYFNCSVDTIRNRMNKYKIPVRKRNKRKTTEEFKKEVYNLVKRKYTVLGEYINNKTPILMRHNECGHEYFVTPGNFLSGRRCPKCANLLRKNTEYFKKEVYNLVGEEYTVLGEYINCHEKILMRHNECGHEFEIEPNNFLQGGRCRKCKESRGERKIRKFLENKTDINFKTWYKFDDCINENPLEFDFVIFNKENNIELIIEFDGIQHEKPIEFFGGIKYFNKLKRNDEIKNNYCEENNIELMRIKYNELNEINLILMKKLKGSGLLESRN
jgi:hypothetical protein